MQTMHFHEADFEYIISRGMKYRVWHMAGPIWSLVGRKQARKCFPFSSGKKCLKDPFCICFEQMDNIIL